MASLIKNMAEPFSATKEYEYGQNVTFQKQPYQRINPLTGSGPWNADDWKPLFLTDMTSGNTVEGDNCLYVAPEYDPEQEEPYNTDDTVLHLGLLHKCKEDNVSGPWDESKWERILLTDVGDLPSSLGSVKKYTINTRYTGSTNVKSLFDLSSVYSNYKNITINDMAIQINDTKASGSLTVNWEYSYNSSTGIITIDSNQTGAMFYPSSITVFIFK